MPILERDDADFGGTVLTLTPPDGIDALPEPLRRALPGALVAAFENPAERLADAAKAVGLPGFAAFCTRLAALPVALEIAADSFAHDDETRLVFGETAAAEELSEDAPVTVVGDPLEGGATGAGALPAPPPLDEGLPRLDLSELDALVPEGSITPEMRAQMQALGDKMQRAFAPPTGPSAPITAAAVALSFAPPAVLDVPPLLQQVYDAVGTVRLGPPGSTAGLVAAQPADYRLDAADPDWLVVFETDTGDVLATTEDGSAAAWLLADDAGETPHPAGTLAEALGVVFATLAAGHMPGAQASPLEGPVNRGGG